MGIRGRYVYNKVGLGSGLGGKILVLGRRDWACPPPRCGPPTKPQDQNLPPQTPPKPLIYNLYRPHLSHLKTFLKD